MRTLPSNLFRAVAALAILLVGPGVQAAGFQQGVAADPGRAPLVIGIWYPSPAAAPSGTAVADARIKAAVIAAPAIGFAFAPDGLRNVTVPVQLWRTAHDTLVPHPRYAEAVRMALPAASDYRVVKNAGHYDLMAPCSDALAKLAASICKSPAGFDRTAFHVDFDAAIVSFFERTLAKR